MISEHWPELPQLGRRSVDRCDVFPVALGVDAIYLNRRGSMKSMLCAAIGTAHSIDGRSYQPNPSKQQLCSARAIHHSLLRSWHQVRFTAQSRKADQLARNGHSLLASTQKLDRPAAMSLWVRWSNTTFMHSPFEILKRELAGSFRRFESVSDLASADIRIKEQTEGGGAENSSRTRPYREQAGRYGASSQSCTTRCKPGQKNSTGVENCQGKRVEN